VSADLSHLDKKLFIDHTVYNCPYCNRNNVPYVLEICQAMDWSETRTAYVLLVRCSACWKRSLHLANSQPDISRWTEQGGNRMKASFKDFDFEAELFYSHPASRFAVDERIQPKRVRDLIIEAIGCLDMNFVTGASACARKAIYELLLAQGAEGDTYEDKIKSLKAKHPNSDPVVFDMLFHIQGATSDVVHEDSSAVWTSPIVRFVLSTLMAAMTEIFVIPDERNARAQQMQELYGAIRKRAGSAPKAEQS
jgi:hypothetical protein